MDFDAVEVITNDTRERMLKTLASLDNENLLWMFVGYSNKDRFNERINEEYELVHAEVIKRMQIKEC